MYKIYLVNDKGGVGKSMTAYHLSAALAHKYGTTLLIDNDHQQSAYKLTVLAQRVLDMNYEDYEYDLEDYEAAGSRGKAPEEPKRELSFAALRMPAATTVSELEEQAQDFKFMVVDTPSGIDRDLLNSIMDSDSLVLVPTAGKLTEMFATADLVDAFSDARATVRVILRQDSRERELSRDELRTANLYGRTMKNSITTYKAYDETIQEGGSVVDVKIKNTNRVLLKARGQMLGLAEEVVSLLEEIETKNQGESDTFHEAMESSTQGELSAKP